MLWYSLLSGMLWYSLLIDMLGYSQLISVLWYSSLIGVLGYSPLIGVPGYSPLIDVPGYSPLIGVLGYSPLIGVPGLSHEYVRRPPEQPFGENKRQEVEQREYCDMSHAETGAPSKYIAHILVPNASAHLYFYSSSLLGRGKKILISNCTVVIRKFLFYLETLTIKRAPMTALNVFSSGFDEKRSFFITRTCVYIILYFLWQCGVI